MEEKTRSYLGTGLLTRNTILNLLGQAAPLLVAIVAIPVLIPRIGTERFGLLVLAWVVLGYFSLFDLGLGRSLTQVVADRLGRGLDEEVPSLARTGLFMMAGVGVAGGALLFLLSPVLTRQVLNVPVALQQETLLAFRLLALGVPFVVLTAGHRGLLEAVQWFGWVNAVRVPQGVLTYLAPITVLPFSRSLVAMVASLVVVRVVSWVAYATLSLRAFPRLRERTALGRTQARALLALGSWITVSNLVSPLMVYLDRFLIGAVLTAAAVAYYATPFEVVTRLWIIPGAVVAVFFPAFATSFRADPARAGVLFGEAARGILLCLFPLAFVLMAFAPEGLALWVGPEFAVPGAPVARWLLVGILVNSVAQVPFAFIQAVGRPDLTAKLHLLEAPIYFGLLWWLLQTHGITGAAVAWTVRVSIDALLLFWLSARLLPEIRPSMVPLMTWTAAGAGILALTTVPIASVGMRLLFLAVLCALAAWGGWRRVLSSGLRRRMRILLTSPGGTS